MSGLTHWSLMLSLLMSLQQGFRLMEKTLVLYSHCKAPYVFVCVRIIKRSKTSKATM